MALLPNTIIYGATGNDSSPTEKVNGGTVIGITSASDTTNGPITQTFTPLDNAIDGDIRRNVPILATGAAHAYSADKAYSSGTFAYEQNQFMIIGVATKINNVTNDSLLCAGSEESLVHRNIANSSKGAKTSSAHRSGYWQGVGVANQRTNWTTSPSSNDVAYVKTTNNGQDASDEAIFVTYKSVPGELAYMYGDSDPLQDEYSAS